MKYKKKKEIDEGLNLSKNLFILGILVVLMAILPLYRIRNLPKQSDLTLVEGILISKEVYLGRKGKRELILALKDYPTKLHVSDLAYKQACVNCSDLPVGDSVFVGINKKGFLNRIGKSNNICTLRNKKYEYLTLGDYNSATVKNNNKFMLIFLAFGLIIISMGFILRKKVLAVAI